jgi:hypothetical protein
MITAQHLDKIKNLLDTNGPGEAGYQLLTDAAAHPTTPCMDDKGPSAFTDTVTLEPGVKYSVFADVVLEIQGKHQNSGFYNLTKTQKIESGLWAMRAFDREVHTSEVDAFFFSQVYRSTTDLMIHSIKTSDLWQPVCLPWMREILEKNIDLMPVASYADFVQAGNTFTKHYTGGAQNFLDKRLFSDLVPYLHYHAVPMNQGLIALVNSSFGIKRDDPVHLSDMTASARKLQALTLANAISALYAHGTRMPAYQLDLALTADLLVIMNQAAMATVNDQDRSALDQAIVELVDMTMTPVKKIGPMRENRFRSGFTNKNPTFWLPHAPQAGLCTVLTSRCASLASFERPQGVSTALSRFINQVRHDAFQGVENALNGNDSSNYNKTYLAEVACDYYKLGHEIDPDSAPAELEARLVARLIKDEKLTRLVSGLSHAPTKARLMRENPSVKGKVLMDELGL